MRYRFPAIKKWVFFALFGVLLILSLSCYCLLKLHQQQQSSPISEPKKHTTTPTSPQEVDNQKQRATMELIHKLAQAKQVSSSKKVNEVSSISYKPQTMSLPITSVNGHPSGVPILELHSIANNPTDPYCISPQNFEAEMKHLSDSGYHPITFTDLEHIWFDHAALPSKPIMLTFDDGYEDNYTTAFPILKKYHLKATIFMVSGFENKPNFLKWDQMIEMEQSGLVEIQSHTVNHHNLTSIPISEAKNEIFDSKSQLQSHLPDPIIAFCYPNGGFNAQIVKLVQQAGYMFATTGEHGYAALVQGPFTLDRELISGFESSKTFAAQFA